MSKFYAVGDKVVLHGKEYKDGEQLPKRKKGYYSLLVGNGITREVESKKVFRASAEDKTSKEKEARDMQAAPEEWGDKPVKVKTKIENRGKK